MDNAMKEKLHFIIESYKEDFERINKEERYKWEAIGWYKKHWDIEAKDFAGMLEKAFGKTYNLLSSGMYYPRKTLIDYAKEHPEEVRVLFRTLHDENILLEERVINFQEGFNKRISELESQSSKKLQHYQDLRAIMLYLTFQYPEKYYLYKATMFDSFSQEIGFVQEKPTPNSIIWKVESFMQLCEIVLEEIKNDTELLDMHKNRLDTNCYPDDALHLLTMDIIYFGSKYHKKNATSQFDYADYWPSLEEYNPKLSKEDWIRYLKDNLGLYSSSDGQ